MRCAIILNRNGGTLRTTDCEALGARLVTLMETAGHKSLLWIGQGRTMVSRLEASAADKDIDCIIIGGGDGSVSLAASLCFRHGKTLGVLPAGTMNFFARSLGMPLDLDSACQALASATVRKVDCGTVNGQVFVHQVSLGIQPRIVEYRNALSYGSRIGKMIASARAGLRVLLRPPSFRARISAADLEDDDRFSIIAVSNNVYQDGQLPFAGKIDDGVLAVYTAPKLSFWRNASLARDLVLGRWTNNEHFLSQSIDRVQIDIRSRVRGRNMSIDGELKPLARRLDIMLHPLSLKVLAPPK
jgi:diacylglycerol kinase family enzyme